MYLVHEDEGLKLRLKAQVLIDRRSLMLVFIELVGSITNHGNLQVYQLAFELSSKTIVR